MITLVQLRDLRDPDLLQHMLLAVHAQGKPGTYMQRIKPNLFIGVYYFAIRAANR